MLGFLIDDGIWILLNGMALGVIAYAIRRGCLKYLLAPLGYLLSLVLIDGVARSYVFHHYGYSSDQYKSFYWFSDVALALGAFFVVCAFFHRACKHDPKLWQFVRLVLSFVFVLVLGISLGALTSTNATHLKELHANAFFFEFQRNLMFTCLVLNTLLYVMMQQRGIIDDQLHLLVCGMGLQFAGPAANFALASLTSQATAQSIYAFVGPLCTLGMLLVWSYVVLRIPKPAPVGVPRKLVPILARSRNAA